YSLSEMWSLGVPVIATRCGSLAERIVDGRTGLLVEPDAERLLHTLQALAEHPERLAALVPGPARSCAAMAHDWRQALPAHARPTAMSCASAHETVRRLELELRLSASRRRAAELVETIASQHAELDARAQWASDLQALAARARGEAERERVDRQALREALADEHAQLEAARLRSESLQAELTEARAQHRAAIADAERLAGQLGSLHAQVSAQESALADLRLRVESVERSEHEAQVDAQRLLEANEALCARYDSLEHALAQAYDLYDRDVADLASQRDIALAQRDQLQAQIATLIESRSWRMTAPFRMLRRRILHLRTSGGFRWRQARNLANRVMLSLGSRGWRGTLERVQQEFEGGRRNAPLEPIASRGEGPIRLPCPSRPTASVIVPAFNQINHTLACLRSLSESGDRLAFEVIV
ncbi:MAG: hypothetical protein CVV17_08775, partial [Gammaproteobacteria bacterium HGW-Gammaproteobacteria-7]